MTLYHVAGSDGASAWLHTVDGTTAHMAAVKDLDKRRVDKDTSIEYLVFAFEDGDAEYDGDGSAYENVGTESMTDRDAAGIFDAVKRVDGTYTIKSADM